MKQGKPGIILLISGRNFWFLMDQNSQDISAVALNRHYCEIGPGEVLVYSCGDVNFTGKRNSI